jgi:hypothetical protein
VDRRDTRPAQDPPFRGPGRAWLQFRFQLSVVGPAARYLPGPASLGARRHDDRSG